MRYEFRYHDPPSDPGQGPDPDPEFWLSIWWGNRGADFWISFFRKIHIRGVLTFWPWCYFLTLVSRLPAIFCRSYPSGCIGHRPLVSSALRSYGDRCRPRVPSNSAACFPPFISILQNDYYVMTLVLLLDIFCPRVVKHSVCLLCFHPLRCHYSCWPKILVLFSPIRYTTILVNISQHCGA